MKTLKFDNVYLLSSASVANRIENQGPLRGQFDAFYEDFYCGEKSYEQGEIRMLRDSFNLALSKNNIKLDDVDLVYGGDLINQLGISHYFMKNIGIPFIGLYGACSTSCLAAINASIAMQNNGVDCVATFCCSHNATAERQFRYPNEYGAQKPVTTTSTVTGAGTMIFSKQKSNIKLTQCTIGKVCDFDFKEVNDMGSAMAIAAYDTLIEHFKNTKTKFIDYDLVLTGDLSNIGLAVLKDMFTVQKYQDLDRLNDCGLLIYDIKKQNVFSGGSGCGCSMLVTIADVFKKLEKMTYKKVLICATGALLSNVMIQQKMSIPSIAHCVVYERV